MFANHSSMIILFCEVAADIGCAITMEVWQSCFVHVEFMHCQFHHVSLQSTYNSSSHHLSTKYLAHRVTVQI